MWWTYILKLQGLVMQVQGVVGAILALPSLIKNIKSICQTGCSWCKSKFCKKPLVNETEEKK